MDTGMIVRTLVLTIALVNQMLVMAGWNTLPFAPDEIESFLTGAFTIVATLIAWWKNNSVTKEAKKADEYLQQLKEEE